jgi:hypothetical protein
LLASLLTEKERLYESEKVYRHGQIPSIDPIRAALLVALLQTPHRFLG